MPQFFTAGTRLTHGDDGIAALLSARAALEPDRIYAWVDSIPLTFDALDRQATAFAAEMRARQIMPGDRVAVMLRNSAANLAVIFGLARAGVAWVPINVRQRGSGLRYLLRHSEPQLLVVEADLLPVVAEVIGRGLDLEIMSSRRDDPAAPLQAALRNGRAHDGETSSSHATAAIMYTSGTTGPPKGVVVSNTMLQLAAEAVAEISAARAGDVFFVWEPLYHIGAAQLLLLPMTRDIQLAIVERFSAGRFWDQVRICQATHIHYLGGILQILLKQPPSADDRAHCVRIAWGGGCRPQIWRQFEERFGLEIRECYGLTEASSITTVNLTGTIGSVGVPLPWFAVELLDEEGHVVADGERGEIVIRTSVAGALFSGYFDDPEATAMALQDGALYTGDLGSYDEASNLIFHGRMTESVRCRGENVSAWEVEHVAAEHPSIEDSAMIGVTADIGEQDIKLFVQARKGCHIDPAEISAWLSQRLAPYQNPRYIAVVEEFERTASQRIIRQSLSEACDDCWDRLATA